MLDLSLKEGRGVTRLDRCEDSGGKEYEGEGGRRVLQATVTAKAELIDARKDLRTFAFLAKEFGLYAQGD